jgi:tRNA(adenine34) deaminase
MEVVPRIKVLRCSVRFRAPRDGIVPDRLEWFRPNATIGRVNYELYMGAALAEARAALAAGEAADGAVAVLDEAMVARGRSQVETTGDPTAHAVMAVLREAARRLGRSDLSGLIVFSAVEPCAMCVGALLESDVDGLVYATPDAKAGAAGSVIQLTSGESLPRRLTVVSGIMQREAAELRVAGARRVPHAGVARA